MSASDAERKLRELSFLHEVARLASSARDWDEMLRVVIGRTTDAMGAEVSSLYLLERSDGVLRLVATNGLNRGGIGRATLRIGEGIVGWVANARVPLAARDVRTDPRWKWVPEVDEKRFTSMLSVPVVARDEVIGVMNVQTVQPRDFGHEEIDFLQTIANQVAGIIEKGRLQRESDRKLREVSALFQGSNVLTSTLDLDEGLSLIVDPLVRVYPGAPGPILLREEGEAVRERARAGELGKTAGAARRRTHRSTGAVPPAHAFRSAHDRHRCVEGGRPDGAPAQAQRSARRTGGSSPRRSAADRRGRSGTRAQRDEVRAAGNAHRGEDR